MANVFDAQIRAIDAATAPMRTIVKGMRDIIQAARGMGNASKKASADAGKAGKDAAQALATASEKTQAAHLRYVAAMGAHARLLHREFQKVEHSIGSLAKHFGAFLPMLGAFSAGASLTGLFMMVKKASDGAVAFQALKATLGLTGREFSGLSWAAKESGVSSDIMVSSLERLNKTMGASLAGKNKDAASLFHHLGISLKDANGHTKNSAMLLPELADAFQKTRDPAMRALMATTLFGKAGQALLPILDKGRDALQKMREQGEKFGYVASDEENKALVAFGENWRELGGAVSGFQREISSKLAPVFAPIVAAVRDWVMANRDWIATAITDKVRALADVLGHLDIKGIVNAMTNWAHSAFDLINQIGGLKTVVGALTLFMGSPLLSAVSSAIGIFMSLGRVMVGLGSLLWANPILAAIGIVAVGAYELYEHWDWVKQQVGAVFTWFSQQSGWVKALLAGIAPFIFVPMTIIEHWEPIKAFFVGLWQSITAGFNAAWSDIQPIVESLKGAVSWAQNSWIGRHLAGAAPAAGAIAQQAPSIMRGPGSVPIFDQTNPALNLYQSGGAGLPSAAQRGEVKVKVDMTGVPQGTRVSTDASGIAQQPDTSVGYINPLAYGY